MIEIKVPVLPESISEATVVLWHKKPGDSVVMDEVLVEIETDKVVLEVPAEESGILTEIIVPEGETVSERQLLATMNDEPDNASPELVDKPVQKKEVLVQPVKPAQVKTSISQSSNRTEERVPMSRLRKTIATRLHSATQSTAMLTTFNEIDMSAILSMRGNYKEVFEKKYGIKLGFMSFFVSAAVQALKKFPTVNAYLDGEDIVYHAYCDVSVAVSSDRGLVVPVLRDAHKMAMHDIERTIVDLSSRAQSGDLTIEEMTGGTFTVSNGGVFGSLMSTPILNSPQSAILGMHKTQERAVVIDGEIVVRPMMYLALSYDHRIIDGKEAVQFLIAIKDALEDPTRLLLKV